MSEVYFVIRDEAGRWIFSDVETDTGLGGAYRSSSEALDVLRNHVQARGLVVGKIQNTPQGFRVEAQPDRPMLYSPGALKVVEEIRDILGRELKRVALERARDAGRSLVTDDDVWAAVDGLDWPSVVEGGQDE